jgi:multiple sugar transport system substrate-binding protein
VTALRPVVALLAATVVAVLAACGGNGAKKDTEAHVTFWTAEDNPERVAATRVIVERYERQSHTKVDIVAVGEDQLRSRIDAASAAGTPPDVLGAISLGLVHSLAADGVTDPAAAAAVINNLGPGTFSKRALSLVTAERKPVAVPSASWMQLLIYRKDLFAKAHLAAPTTFATLRTAATRLTAGGTVGIVAATKPDDSFTQQVFEYLALANGCQLTDSQGRVSLTSKACLDAFTFYVDLIRRASARGIQDADTARHSYLAGTAAMMIWSSFILDELAGLSDDARPTCQQCGTDPSFLSKNSGIVTGIRGPDAAAPAQFGELTSFAISKDGNKAAAAKFVEFMLGDGYVDWLALAPEGKFPVRTGTKEQPGKFVAAWNNLQTGSERKEALSRIYSAAVLRVLATSTDTMNRWGFPQGQAQLAAAQLVALPVPKALAAAFAGTLSPVAAAQEAQADVEKLARPLRRGG